MATKIILPALPPSLILLVHLHLLEYPHADRSEYDHNVFNPKTRGLKDRTKTMEDISYFLVRKLERDRVKTTLPNYPCKKPSDNVAYRTALTKYLEGVRHSAIGGSHAPTTSRSAKGSPKEATMSKAGASAAWWKDVLVRKSTIEECAGEKFEKIMVALSIEVLMRYVKGARDPAILYSPEAQPLTYPTMLSSAMHARKEWSRRMEELRLQQTQLQRLKERLRQSTSTKSKYEGLTTQRLVEYAESKYQDLLSAWSVPALDFLIETAGVSRQDPAGTTSSKVAPSTTAFSRSTLLKTASTSKATAPQPLPVAAAHHPSYLKKLRKPLSAGADPSRSRASQSRPHASDRGVHASDAAGAQAAAAPQTARLVERERQMKRALLRELDKVRRRRGEAEERLLQALRQKRKPAGRARQEKLDIWVPPSPTIISFDVPLRRLDSREADTVAQVISDKQSAHELTASDPFVEPLQTRVDRVRARWKASPERLSENQASRIPKPPLEYSKPATSSNLQTRNAPPASAATSSRPHDPKREPSRTVSQADSRTPRRARKSARMSLVRPPVLHDVEDAEVTQVRIASEFASTPTNTRAQILDQLRDDSDEEWDESTRILSTPGKPLASLSRAPGSVTSTVKRRPRETFAMPTGGDPIELPTSGLEDDEGETSEGDDSGYEEGHSVSLRDILLQADMTGINLAAHLADEMDDDDPFY
ncbi:hypothetical protein GGG16DRAFT_129608 [Schizophyllum commune]